MWTAAAAVLLTASLTDASPAAGGPAQCTAAQQTVRLLLPELERSIKPDGMKAAERYVAKPPPATSPEKAWGDFAAGISLAGERQLAAWAGLKATTVRWNGETVANAGVYIFRLGKPREALALLECAQAAGYRSPYLQEALATVNHKLGRAAEARKAIDEAQKMAPEDELIEASASFIKTGKPPPSRPALKDDYDETLREVQAHADRVLATMKAQAMAIQSAVPRLNAMTFYDIKEKYLRAIVAQLASRIAPLRTAGGEARMRDARVNDFSIVASHTYTQITDALLNFPNTISTNGSPLLFWSEVLSLDPPVLARETEDGRGQKWGSDASLVQPSQDRYRSEKSANDLAYAERRHACKTTECTIRVKGDWCLQWKPIHDRWVEGSRQRLNPAARRFDQVATRTMADVEVELLDAQDFSQRQYARMKFWQVPGLDMQQQHAQVINGHLKIIYERHVGSAGRGASGYLGDRAKWFAGHRAHVERAIESEGKDMQQQCAPALRALLELLIEEEWQAYLAHLREKALWGIQGQVEGDFVCEGTIGPVTVLIDLDKPGSGKVNIKWSTKKLPGSITTSGTVSEDQEFGVNVGYGGSRKGDGGGASGSVGTDGARGSVGYGSYRAKGKATLITVSSPYDKRKYTGIKIKGAGGFGLGGKKAGGACYPSSGSVTFVPRAILENGIKYINAPSRAPRS